MALLDLSTVTKALGQIIEANIVRLDPSFLGVVHVSPEAPERLGSATNTISLHLYHVIEEGHYKNLPGPGRDVPNIPTAPMGITLYYLLTAFQVSTDTQRDAFDQQRLFGYALKTLHDIPVITAETTLPGQTTPVLPPGFLGSDDHLQVILRPVSVDDALHYWSATADRTTRLSAYYEVRVILLEPERARRMPGLVLGLGNYVVEMGAPTLERSESLVRFTLPARLGGADETIGATPARVALSVQPPPFSRFVLRGSALTGLRQSLILRNGLWPRRGLPERTAVDASWPISVAPDRFTVDLQTQIVAGGQTFPIFPGVYTAAVRVVKSDAQTLAGVREVAAASNELAFAITPRLIGHGVPDPVTHRVTVDIEPTFNLLDPLLEDSVVVVLDGATCDRFASFPPPPADAGTFIVSSPSQVTVQARAAFQPGLHPFRLIVNGAESQPFWIEV